MLVLVIPGFAIQNTLTFVRLMETISVTSPADFHTHLRQPPLSDLVTPHVLQGGFRLAYVMVAIDLLCPHCCSMFLTKGC